MPENLKKNKVKHDDPPNTQEATNNLPQQTSIWKYSYVLLKDTSHI